MTVASVRNKVRRLIQDTDSGDYHWTDVQIRDDMQSAIDALHKIRPETRYVNGLLVDRVTLPAIDGDTIQIDERFSDAIVYFTAYMAYSDDCTDPVSKTLADDFLAKFNSFAQL